MTSPEISKELAEKLGEKYEFNTAFVRSDDGHEYHKASFDALDSGEGLEEGMEDIFTMEELWEWLPKRFLHNDDLHKTIIRWEIKNQRTGLYTVKYEYANQCDSLAKLLLWCLKHGHLLNECETLKLKK